MTSERPNGHGSFGFQRQLNKIPAAHQGKKFWKITNAESDDEQRKASAQQPSDVRTAERQETKRDLWRAASHTWWCQCLGTTAVAARCLFCFGSANWLLAAPRGSAWTDSEDRLRKTILDLTSLVALWSFCRMEFCVVCSSPHICLSVWTFTSVWRLSLGHG